MEAVKLCDFDIASIQSIVLIYISLWVSVEELTGKSYLLMVSSDTVPFLHSHIMPLFTMQVDSGLSTWGQ